MTPRRAVLIFLLCLTTYCLAQSIRSSAVVEESLARADMSAAQTREVIESAPPGPQRETAAWCLDNAERRLREARADLADGRRFQAANKCSGAEFELEQARAYATDNLCLFDRFMIWLVED